MDAPNGRGERAASHASAPREEIPRPWLGVAAVGIALLMSALDATVVALALPDLAQQYHVSGEEAVLVFLGYSVPLTALLLPAGGWVSRFRPWPLFALAVLGFAASSVLCGVAPLFSVLLLGRILQGGSAALLATQGFVVAAAAVPPQERGRAVGAVGALAPLGGVLGPAVGGLLIGSFGASSVFFVNVPVCLAALVLGALGLRSVARVGPSPRGTLRAAGELLRRREFTGGLLAFLASVCGSTALYYLLPFALFGLDGLGAESAGLLLLAVPLGMVVGGPLGGMLRDRFGGPRFMVLGAALAVAAALLLERALSGPPLLGSDATLLATFGVGVGLFTAPASTQLMSVGPRESLGAASALLNLSARLGAVAGPLVLSVSWALAGGPLGAGVSLGLGEVAAFAALALLLTLVANAPFARLDAPPAPERGRPGRPPGADAPAPPTPAAGR